MKQSDDLILPGRKAERWAEVQAMVAKHPQVFPHTWPDVGLSLSRLHTQATQHGKGSTGDTGIELNELESWLCDRASSIFGRVTSPP